MSYRYLAAVWSAFLQPAGLKLVAATLADRANDDGGGIRLSQDTIGKRTSLSGRQVRHWLRTLEHMAVLTVEKPPTQHSPTHYRMQIDTLQTLASAEADRHPDDEPDRKPASAQSKSRPEVQRRQTGSAASPDRKPASDKTSQRRPKTSLGERGGRDAPDAAGAAPSHAPLPDCVDPAAWQELLDVWRPNLDAGLVLTQARRYAAAGRTTDEISAGIRSLALNPHHRNLALPKPPAVRKASRGPRPPENFDGIDYHEGL